MLIIKTILILITLVFLTFLLVSSYKGIRLEDNNKDEDLNIILAALLGFAGGIMTSLGLDSSEHLRPVLEEDLNNVERVKNTLMIGATVPIIIAGILFINNFKLDIKTMVFISLSGLLGIIFSIVFKLHLSVNKLREYNAIILLLMACLFLFQKFVYIKSNPVASFLKGQPLIIGMATNFILGIILTQGISVYTPAIGIFIFLGVTPRSALTLILIASGFMLPMNSFTLIRSGNYYKKTAILLSITGIIGAYFGLGFFMKQTIEMVKWLIIITMVSSGVTNLIQSQVKERSKC